MRAAFVDDVPVLFGEDDEFATTLLAERLGPRLRCADWDGDFPLTGELLARSLHVLETVVEPLVPPDWLV